MKVNHLKIYRHLLLLIKLQYLVPSVGRNDEIYNHNIMPFLWFYKVQIMTIEQTDDFKMRWWK